MTSESRPGPSTGISRRLYAALVRSAPDAERQVPEPARRQIPYNALHMILANALQSSGDKVVNAATVLPWLFAVLGVPAALTGVLVPIRESGSMLPQALLTPLVLRARQRKWIFVAGALVQAGAAGAMAVVAAVGHGLAAGLLIVAALVIFALGRCLCSIASKDVLGRTIPKSARGQITGLATTAGGLVAITLGLAIRFLGQGELSAGQLAGLLGAAVVLWAAVAVVYAGIREPAGQDDAGSAAPPQGSGAGQRNWLARMGDLLRQDKAFRHFVGVRSLLLVSSLSQPFIVTLSIQSGAGSLAGLGGFIIASGVAAMLGGRLFGRFADRASNKLMTLGAAVSSAVILATVLVVALPGFDGRGWAGNLLFIAAYFALALMHTGVRVGRQTYVVDMAEGDRRTVYVAVSNSAMGLILLVVGAFSSLLAVIDLSWALLFLAAMGLAGVAAGSRLPNVAAR